MLCDFLLIMGTSENYSRLKPTIESGQTGTKSQTQEVHPNHKSQHRCNRSTGAQHRAHFARPNWNPPRCNPMTITPSQGSGHNDRHPRLHGRGSQNHKGDLKRTSIRRRTADRDSRSLQGAQGLQGKRVQGGACEDRVCSIQEGRMQVR